MSPPFGGPCQVLRRAPSSEGTERVATSCRERGPSWGSGSERCHALRPSSEGWAEKGLEKEQGVPSARWQERGRQGAVELASGPLLGRPVGGADLEDLERGRTQGLRPSQGTTGFSSTEGSAGALSRL